MSDSMDNNETNNYMTDKEKSRCHAIIHSAAVAAGGIGAGLAQLPMSDNLLIMPIQIGMVTSLGNVFGKSLSESTVKSLISAAAGTVVGRSVSQALLGWIPILGNGINAATAFTITESIGWVIANNFARESAEARRKLEEKERRLQEEAKRREEQQNNEQTEAATQVISSIENVTQYLRQSGGILQICLFFVMLWNSIAYVCKSIWGTIRGFRKLVKDLFSNRAGQAIRWILQGLRNWITALIGNVSNFIINWGPVIVIGFILYKLGVFAAIMSWLGEYAPIAAEFIMFAVKLIF